MARVTYKLRESNGKPFSISGTGTTRAAAVDEANAKLALTVGTVESGTVSETLAPGEEGDANAGTVYSDAEFEMKNAVGKVVTVHLENISNSFGDGVTGDLDLTDPLLIAFATAYRDGNGLGTYVPNGGKFVP